MNVIRSITFSLVFLLLHPAYILADDDHGGRHWNGREDHGRHGDDHGRHEEHGDHGEHHEGWRYHSGFSYNFTYWPDSYNYYTGPYVLPPTVVETPTIVNPPVVVESPVDVTTPVPVNTDENEFIVNIPNDSGGYTAVIIRRSGSGFIGPQGEYYPQFPSVAQLKLMYTRK